MNIEQLLASEKSRPGFTTEARAAMWSGIEQTVTGAAIAGGAVAGGAAVAKAAGAKAAGAKTAATVTAAKIATWKIGTLAAIALAIGAGGGAAAHARWGAPRTVYVEREAKPIAITAATANPVIETTPAIAASALPPAASAKTASTASARTPAVTLASAAPSAAAAPKDPGLARERTLLDMARTALGRGDTASALSAVDTHAREFPKSQLAQEREVIAIQALAAAGRSPEARRRAAAFRMAFPGSPLQSIVDDATQ